MSSVTKYMIEFPSDLHKAAKLRAVEEGITLKELIIKAVMEYLKKGG
ncbi:MAG: 3-hydroxyacyl-CoA dehydrogenase [Deltaproteobacteria bacterium]|nr:3-hydroxyacyl-CoA dehydrogenase [Deltaproteobacteria bacterium]